MNLLANLLDPDLLLESMSPFVIVGLVVYIFIQRKLMVRRELEHQEEVYHMNQERSEWRVTRQRHQAAISELEGKLQQKQDDMDKLTAVSVPEFFHLN